MSKKPSENPARPDSRNQDTENDYAQMAREKKREVKALEWSEALISDVSDDEAR
ncbi:MAG: hypothetical protein IH820_13650 [Bacteroidetes bacterium]|nr:hypothetical protein [Bacteroidota bacterium]